MRRCSLKNLILGLLFTLAVVPTLTAQSFKFGVTSDTQWGTGWADKDGGSASNILTLWGMGDLNSNKTDPYTLSLSYSSSDRTGKGASRLAAKDAQGKWVNAVNENQGGTKKHVAGPWKSGYPLGTYGIDSKTNTAWAVINYTGDFAVARLGQ